MANQHRRDPGPDGEESVAEPSPVPDSDSKPTTTDPLPAAAQNGNKSASSHAEILTIPFDFPGPKPASMTVAYATVREIDFEIPNGTNDLWFFFSKWSNNVSLNDYGGIQGLVDAILTPGQFAWDGSRSDPVLPYASPLSLGNEQLRYVVYVLSAKNWQFVRKGRPITIGKKGLAKPIYFDVHRVWAAGANGNDEGSDFDDETAPLRDNCKIAYMIADGASAKNNEPTRKYAHPINLHVDLIYPGPRHMPIMVDPDIRYPGGSEG